MATTTSGVFKRFPVRSRLSAIGQRWERVNLEAIFLLFATVTGLAFIALNPPLQGFDEIQHYERAYQLSTGNLFSDEVRVTTEDGHVQEGYGGRLPQHLVDVIERSSAANDDAKTGHRFRTVRELWNNPPRGDRLVPVRFDNTALYSPVAYAPEMTAIWLARTSGLPDIGQIYAARLAQLLCWLVLMWAAIRVTPVGREIFVVLALNPLALWQATTMSPDAMGAALLAVCVAVILRLRTPPVFSDDRPPPTALQAVLLVAVLGACTIKVSYLPIAALVMFVPDELRRRGSRIAVGLVVLLMATTWHVLVLPATSGIPELQAANLSNGVVNAHDQMTYILHHLPQFFGILLLNIVGWNSLFWGDDYVAQLSYTSIPRWVPYVWLALLFYAVTLRRPEPAYAAWRRAKATVWGMLAVATASAFMVVGALYVGWSYIGSEEIMGVQRRYWIPLTFLAIPLFIGARPYFDGRRKNLVLGVGAAAVLAAGALTLYFNYQGYRVAT